MLPFLSRNFIFPIIGGKNYLRTRSQFYELKKNQYIDTKTIKELNFYKLKKLLIHAYYNTEFYNKKFVDYGFYPDKICSFEEIRKIPPLTREDLNKWQNQLISKNYSSNDLHFATTGGSTGVATRFARNNNCLTIKKANEFRFNSFSGWELGEKILYYWPALSDFSKTDRKLSYREKYFKKEMLLFSGKLNEKLLHEHFDVLKKFQPQLLRAFPSSLQIFAEFLKNKKIKFGLERGIICVGEPLNNYQRNLFREIFNCGVYNCYASRECGNIACECSEGEGLHVAEDLLYVEIENQIEECYGNILLTDLHNYGMPLIRYSIQDFSKFKKKKCKCGISLDLLEIDGARISDYIISPLDNSYISSSAMIHYLLAENPSVGKVKIIQNKVDKLDIQIVCSGDEGRIFKEHVEAVVKKIFKEKMKVEFHNVDEIPLLPSGKYQFIKRNF
jgi:phenylacetate-CoA ligase